MESVKVKEEPADENSLQIKAEPLDLEEDDSIDQNLFVPRIDFGVNNPSETDDDNLRHSYQEDKDRWCWACF